MARQDREIRDLALDKATCLSRALGSPEGLLPSPTAHWPTQTAGHWAPPMSSSDTGTGITGSRHVRTKNHRAQRGVRTTQEPRTCPASATAPGMDGQEVCPVGPGLGQGGRFGEKPCVVGWARRGPVGTAL